MRSMRFTSSDLRRDRVAVGVYFFHSAFEALKFAKWPAHDAVFTADLLERRETHAHLLCNSLLRQVEVLRELLELHRRGRHHAASQFREVIREEDFFAPGTTLES
jgi:hypothetical protein